MTRVYIFGSQVKGRARYGSDIDLCIISPAFGQDRQKERIMLMNLIPFPPMIFRTNRILLRGKFKKQEFLCNYSRKTVCFRPEKDTSVQIFYEDEAVNALLLFLSPASSGGGGR